MSLRIILSILLNPLNILITQRLLVQHRNYHHIRSTAAARAHQVQPTARTAAAEELADEIEEEKHAHAHEGIAAELTSSSS